MKKVEIPAYGKQAKGAFNRTRQDVRLSDKPDFPFTPESLRGGNSKQ